MIRRTSIAVALVVVAASCTWPMAGQGPERRNWAGTERAITPADTGRIRAGWSAPASGATEVVGDAQRVFVRSPDLLQALDPSTGAEQWHVAAPGRSVPGLVGDGVVVVTDGGECTVRRLAASSGAAQATATIGYPYGADAQTRNCTAGRSVLTENGRIAVSTFSRATFTVLGCPGTRLNQLWSDATTVTVLDATLQPIWTATDATYGCGPQPAMSSVVPFGDVTRTATHYGVPQGKDLVAFPQTCTTPCTASWRHTFGGDVRHVAAVPGNRLAVGADVSPMALVSDATGATVWTGATGAASGFAATDTTIFVLASPDVAAYTVGGCGAATCNPIWTGSLGGRIPLFEPIVAGDVLIVPAWEGPGLFFDARGCGAATCAPLAGQAPGFDTQGATSVINGRIYASSATSGVLTFEVAPA